MPGAGLSSAHRIIHSSQGDLKRQVLMLPILQMKKQSHIEVEKLRLIPGIAIHTNSL
jgi:hypothetical protein